MSRQFVRLQQTLTELIAAHRAVQDYIVNQDDAKLLALANQTATTLRGTIVRLPAQNSRVIQNIVVGKHNLIEAIRLSVTAYTGIAQALQDDTLSYVQTQREFRRSRKRLEEIGSEVQNALAEMTLAAAAAARSGDAAAFLTFDPPDTAPQELSEAETSPYNRSFSTEELKRMRAFVATTPQAILAAKGITVNSLKDLGAYLDLFRKTQDEQQATTRDLEQVEQKVRIATNALKLGPGKQKPDKGGPSMLRPDNRVHMGDPDTRIRVVNPYDKAQHITDVSPDDDPRSSQHALERNTADSIKVMQETERELADLPSKPLAEAEWKPCRLPIWVQTGNFIDEKRWQKAQIEVTGWQMGWVLHNQLVVALPITVVKLGDAALEEHIAGIQKAIEARSQPLVDMNQGKPFTVGGHKGFCYIWFLERARYNTLGTFRLLSIGFPRATAPVKTVAELPNIVRRNQSQKEGIKQKLSEAQQAAKLLAERKTMEQEAERRAEAEGRPGAVREHDGVYEGGYTSMLKRIERINEELIRLRNKNNIKAPLTRLKLEAEEIEEEIKQQEKELAVTFNKEERAQRQTLIARIKTEKLAPKLGQMQAILDKCEEMKLERAALLEHAAQLLDAAKQWMQERKAQEKADG